MLRGDQNQILVCVETFCQSIRERIYFLNQDLKYALGFQKCCCLVARRGLVGKTSIKYLLFETFALKR